MYYLSILMGSIGFIGFESLRVYKIIIKGNPLPFERMLKTYCISVLGIIIFCGIAGAIIARENYLLALYIGFSFPTSAKFIFDKGKMSKISKGLDIDDVELINKDSSFINNLYEWFQLMFGI